MSTATAVEVRAWLQPRLEQVAELLDRMVRIETPSTAPATIGPLLELVDAELRMLGFTSRRVDGVHSAGWLVARRDRDPTDVVPQLVVGHLDTVWPVGTLATRPRSRTGTVLRGPGAYDMKAGVVQTLGAIRALDALDVTLPVPPVLLFTTDEEVGSRESTPALVTLARHVDRALVTEPSLGPLGRIKTGRKGVGRFTLTVSGRAAHAGLDPEGGASAILELSHVIQSLFALNDPAAGVTVNVGTIDGGLRPNVVAPVSTAVADVRVLTYADARRVETAIRALEPATPGTTLEVEGGFGRPPMERTDGTAALWALAVQAGESLGIELEEGTAGGASDGNTTSAFTPTLDGLGAVGDGAHAVHEHVALDRVAERAGVLAALLAAPPVRDPAPTLPPGGVPGLLRSLPTPAQTGPVTAAEAIMGLGDRPGPTAADPGGPTPEPGS